MTSIGDALSAHLDAICQMMPILYDDVATIVLNYAQDDISLHLTASLSICMMTEPSPFMFAPWYMRFDHEKNIIHISVTPVVFADGHWVQDELDMHINPSEFVWIMGRMELNHHLRERFQPTGESALVRTDIWSGLFDHVANAMITSFVPVVQRITTRLG